jgi:hypothetical protein
MATKPIVTLRPSKAPNLPLAPVTYDSRQQEQFSNALRLYFAQIDNDWQAILGENGSRYLQTPHIAASANADQYALGDNTPTLVAWDAVESISGFTLNPGGYAIADQNGVYKIDYSLQLANTDNAQHDVFVWLQVNGNLVVGSSSRFTVPARKSAGVFGFVVAYSSIEFEIVKDDQIRLWWATEKAATSGGTLGVFMDYIAAQTSPYPRPSNPSAIGSINFVSRLPA